MEFNEYNISKKRIQFLCEQDGVPERELKKELCNLFVHDRKILKAYLVRMAYDSSDEYLVGLCVSIDSGKKLTYIRKISKIFSNMFRNDQHIEIMFLDNETESKVIKVCEPFYIRNTNERTSKITQLMSMLLKRF